MKKRKAKKTTRKAQSKNKKTLHFYIWGTLILIIALTIGIYTNSNNELNNTISDYIHHKQALLDVTGSIKDIDFDTPWSPDTNKKHKLNIQITGSKKSGLLVLNAAYKNKSWQLSNISFKSKDRTISLHPTYVGSAVFYAASKSSAPLKRPIFLAGEDAYIQVYLKGVLPQSIAITESLSLYNENNELIITQPNIATFRGHSQPSKKTGARFTNKISDLSPGRYYAELKFYEESTKPIETFWQEIDIKKPVNTLFVKSVKYFSDKNMSKSIQPEFDPGQNVYLRMSLDGFNVRDTKIAGNVDLQIANAEGEVVAFKPKFASFNQIHDKQKNIVIDGTFKLKDPDIYFLSFRVHDFFTGEYITHEEKVIVHLGDRDKALN